MAINKVVIGDTESLDLTGDTVTASDVAYGKTFHDKTGTKQTGSYAPEDWIAWAGEFPYLFCDSTGDTEGTNFLNLSNYGSVFSDYQDLALDKAFIVNEMPSLDPNLLTTGAFLFTADRDFRLYEQRGSCYLFFPAGYYSRSFVLAIPQIQ